MKRIILFTILSVFALTLNAQIEITSGMTGAQLRNALNANYDTIFNGNFREGIEIGGYRRESRIDSATIEGASLRMYSNGVLLNTGGTSINVKDYGAVGDSITNDRTAILNAFAAAKAINGTLYFPSGNYFIGSSITFDITNSDVIIEGSGKSLIVSVDRMVGFQSTTGANKAIDIDIVKGSTSFTSAAIASSVKPGDILHINSTEQYANYNISYHYKGEMVEVLKISGNVVYIKAPFYDWYSKTNTQVKNMNAGSIKITNLNFRKTQVAITNARNSYLRYCDITNGDYYGLQVYNIINFIADNMNISKTDDILGSWDYGIGLTLVQNASVTNCKIYNYKQAIAAGGSYPCRNYIVAFNSCFPGTNGSGAQIDTHTPVEYAIITGNRIINGGIYAKGSNIDITENYCDGPDGQIAGYREDLVDEPTHDLHLTQYVNIDNNVCNNLRFGFASYRDTIDYIRITRNRVYAEEQYALLVYRDYDTDCKVKEFIVSDNYLSNDASSQFYTFYMPVSYNTDNFYFKDNIVKSTNFHCLYMATVGGMEYGNVSGNSFMSTLPGRIVYFVNFQHLYINDNTFHGTPLITSNSKVVLSNNIFRNFSSAGVEETEANPALSSMTTFNNVFIPEVSQPFALGHPTTAQINEIRYLSGSLTDNNPSNAEINAICGSTAVLVGRGYTLVIKDTNGSAVEYSFKSNGTNWVKQSGPSNNDLVYFNVKDYGAKGDGVTNDATAINNCFNAAISAEGTVYFPTGEYYYPGQNTIYTTNKNLRIVGAEKAIIRGNYDSDGLRFWSAFGANDTFTSDTLLTGSQVLYTNTLYNTVKSDDILYIESTNFLINEGIGSYYKGELVKVKNVVGNKIMLTAPIYDSYNTSTTIIKALNSGSVKVDNIVFDSLAVTSYYNQNVEFKNCYWKKTSYNNLQLYYSYNGLVDNCMFTRDTSYVYAGNYALTNASCHNVYFTNNTFSNYVQAIENGGRIPSRNIFIENNTISSYREGSSYTLAAHGHCEYVRVVNNHINNGGIAIGGSFVDIRGNQVRLTENLTITGYATSTGIRRFYENLTNVVSPPPRWVDNISDNIVLGSNDSTGYYGIMIYASSYKDTIPYINISNNHVRVGGYAFILTGTYNSVFQHLNFNNNHFENTWKPQPYTIFYAVYATANFAVNQITFTGNTVKSVDKNMYFGINSINLLKISNNIFNNFVYSKSNALTNNIFLFENNVIKDNGQLIMAGGFDVNIVKNNNFLNNNDIILSLSGTDSVFIQNNTYPSYTQSIDYEIPTTHVYRDETGYFKGNLTDGNPSDAEVDAIVGVSATNMTKGYKAIVADLNGTKKIYRFTSNGTDWIVDGSEMFAPIVSPTFPNGITISGNDALSLTGDATVFDDLTFPFSIGQTGNATHPSFNADSLYFTFEVDSTGIDADYMYFIIQMPHKMKTGSTIYPHVHYKQEDATTDTPVFIMKYKWYNLGGTTQKEWKWKKMATSTGTTDKTHQLVYSTTGIAGTGITEVSSLLICQIYLFAPAAGNTTCNAYQFDIHYEMDALGSRTQLAK